MSGRTVAEGIAAAEAEGRIKLKHPAGPRGPDSEDGLPPEGDIYGPAEPAMIPRETATVAQAAALFDAGPPDVVVIDGLPFPPSVNHYFTNQIIPREKGKGFGKANVFRILRFPTKEAKAFEEECLLVIAQVKPPKLKGFLKCEIVFYPPNRLLRDLDNLPKCLLDGLTKAGVFGDDSQIHDLNAKWAKAADGSILTKPGGKSAIRLTTLGV